MKDFLKKLIKWSENSETAKINTVALFCYTVIALGISILAGMAFSSPTYGAVDTVIKAVIFTFAWLPVLFGLLSYGQMKKRPVLFRDIFFGLILLFYAVMLIESNKVSDELVAIPFMIITIAYCDYMFTSIVSGLFVTIEILHAVANSTKGDTKALLVSASGVFVALVTMILIVEIVHILEGVRNNRNLELNEEKAKLESLIALSIDRIFEYDVKNDIMEYAGSRDGVGEDREVISNFSNVAKQYRYVLNADWEKLDALLNDCKWGVPIIEHELRIRMDNGDYEWHLIKGRPILDEDGKPEKIVGFFKNINESKRLELRQADANMRDSLTKLYKMDYARQLIEQYLSTPGKNAGDYFAGLITIDMDDFGIINGRMGKSFGDEILKNIAEEIDGIFYTSDLLGRVGGDEFIIFMKDMRSVDDILLKVKELQEVISRTYVGEDAEFNCTAGVGISVYPKDGRNFEELYSKAEKAMIHAKQNGRNNFELYDDSNKAIYDGISMDEFRDKKTFEDDDNAQRAANSDSIVELAFKLMDESKDTDSAINLLIRQLAKQLNLGGICIRTRIGSEFRTITRYQCSTIDDLEFDNTDMTYSIAQWNEMLNEYRTNDSLIAYDNVDDVDNVTLRQILLSMGAQSYVGCAFYDKGEFLGNIDFVDFDSIRTWTSEELTNMRAVANVVSSYLLKMKAFEDASNTVERLTGYDGVTGLLMYEKFLMLSGEYIENAPHGQYAILYLDISNFKVVNETYGYEIGDKILRSLAKDAARYKDFYVYGSRVFSDNLVFLVKIGDANLEELTETFNVMIKQFGDRMQLEYIDSKLMLNVGVCMFEICGQPVPLKNIISNANVARKRTKLPDMPRIIFYQDEMGDRLKTAVAYAADMESAFKNHEFIVYLQPKVSLKTGQIDGAEALIRWKKQDGRMIFPNDFIPVFEKNKSITLLDYYVYDEICKYLRNRIDAGKRVVRISVNVSRVHLFSIDELVGYIKSLINKYKLPPELLEFELTETVFTDKVDDTIQLMSKLRELGVLISMDDFGSGYSSLNVLTKLPLDVLKLDKEFLNDFDNDPDEKIIIPSVIEMAKKLNLSVVCEGVETGEQVEFLTDVGCDYAQGYYYSKPIPQDQFNELLEV